MESGSFDTLSESERCSLLLNSITDYAIYMLDAAGRVSSWNTGAERCKGYRSSEILGEHFSRFYTDEDRAAGVPQRTLSTAAGDGRFEGEGWRQRKDGTRFWAHVVVDPILSQSGEVIGFAKITRDLTEKKAAEDALIRNREQFRLLVQGVTDYAIYMLDPSGNVSSWNSGAQRIKGYEHDEIIGEHFSRFYVDEDQRAGVPARALEAAKREGRFENEGWRVRKDGSRFWASVVVDAIRDDDGELLGFAKVTRDVTEKREAQRALEHAQEELLQSRKLEALGQLAGGVAHDFNNLLMAISGSLELLRKRIADDPRITPLLDNALQGAQRGKSLTERLLTFSRRQPLNPQPVDLPNLVRGLRDLLQLSVGGDISINMKSSLSVPAALVDANQLELALLNVAANARDAMPEGGTLTIAISEETVAANHPAGLAEGRYVRLSASDTGTGMDQETLARAADPFFTTKGPGKGTGLGLSVVHGLMQDSGGRLILKSSEGRGTTVEMWLQTISSRERGQPRWVRDEAAPEDAPAALRVLAVDDDALVLMNTAMMLEDLGHTVFQALSGAAALKQLDSESVDLVITDHGMPGMSGLQLMDAVRERTPNLPVVLATGYSELPNESRTFATLNKPFGLEELRSAVQEAMAMGPRADLKERA